VTFTVYMNQWLFSGNPDYDAGNSDYDHIVSLYAALAPFHPTATLLLIQPLPPSSSFSSCVPSA
jgi:hypothetical protein